MTIATTTRRPRLLSLRTWARVVVALLMACGVVLVPASAAWADVDSRPWTHVAAASPDNYWVIESPTEGNGAGTTGCDTTWTIKRNPLMAARAAYDYFELRWYKGSPGSDPALVTTAAASVQNGNAAAVVTRDNTVSTTVCSTGFAIVKVEIFDQGYGTTANTGGCTRPGGCTSGAVNYTVKRGTGNVNITDTSCAYGAFSQLQASWYQGHLWVSWRWVGKDTTGQTIPYFLVQYGSTPTDLQAGAAYPAPSGTLGTKQADGYYMAQQAPFPLATNPTTVKVSFYKTTSAVACPATTAVLTSRAIVPGAPAGPTDYGNASDPDGGISCSGFDLVCRFKALFYPSTSTRNQISGLTTNFTNRPPMSLGVSGFAVVYTLVEEMASPSGNCHEPPPFYVNPEDPDEQVGFPIGPDGEATNPDTQACFNYNALSAPAAGTGGYLVKNTLTVLVLCATGFALFKIFAKAFAKDSA